MRKRLPGESTLSPGVCAGLVGPRSYEVKVGERTFVRNCRHLIRSNEVVVEDGPEVEPSPREENTETTPSQDIASPPTRTHSQRWELQPLSLLLRPQDYDRQITTYPARDHEGLIVIDKTQIVM